MHGLYFDDFKVGDRFTTAGYTFTEAAIIDFAFQYDPQPFHLDVEAARNSVFGGLVASGFHTLSVCFRLIYQQGVFATANMGGRGLDELRWTRAVRPGDTIHVEMEVLEVTPSSRPDRGNMRMAFAAKTAAGETVMTAVLMPVLARRPA